MAPPFGSGPPWRRFGVTPQGVPPDPPQISSAKQAPTTLPYVGRYAYTKLATPPTLVLSCDKGNGIVVFVIYNSTAPSLSDNLGNTYTPVWRNAVGDGNVGQYCWVCPSSIGTNPKITIGGSPTQVVVFAWEIVGANPGAFVDGLVFSTTVAGSQALHTTTPNGLIISDCLGSLSRNPPAGYTVVRLTTPSSGDTAQNFCWSPSPLATQTKFPGWSGANGTLSIAIRGAGQFPDHTPLKPSQIQYPPWMRRIRPELTANARDTAIAVNLGDAGQVATFDVGTLTPEVEDTGPHADLTGADATFDVGTLAPSSEKTLDGAAATFTAGTAIATPAVDGASQAATFAAGSVGVGIDAALTNQAITSAAGTLKATLDLALSGQGLTVSAGAVIATPAVALTSQTATFAAGAVDSSREIGLTGQTATFARGLFQGFPVQLDGVGATFDVGAPVPAFSVTFTGQAGTFAAGTLEPGKEKALTGQAATFAASETVDTAVTVALAGVGADFSVGSIGTQGGILVAKEATEGGEGYVPPRRRRRLEHHLTGWVLAEDAQCHGRITVQRYAKAADARAKGRIAALATARAATRAAEAKGRGQAGVEVQCRGQKRVRDAWGYSRASSTAHAMARMKAADASARSMAVVDWSDRIAREDAALATGSWLAELFED